MSYCPGTFWSPGLSHFFFFVLFIHPPFCGAFVSFRGSSVSSHQCNNQSNKSGQKYQFHLQKRKRERERVRGALGPPHVPPPFGSSGSECLGLRQVVYSTLSGACAQLSAASVNKVDEGVETEPCGTRVSWTSWGSSTEWHSGWWRSKHCCSQLKEKKTWQPWMSLL